MVSVVVADAGFLIAIDLWVLIASQFDKPRKKESALSFTGYKMSNIKPGIYNSRMDEAFICLTPF